jgi:hypothetical protein
MSRPALACLVVLSIFCPATIVLAQPQTEGARRPAGGEQIRSIEDRTSGLKKIDRFFPLYLG